MGSIYFKFRSKKADQLQFPRIIFSLPCHTFPTSPCARLLYSLGQFLRVKSHYSSLRADRQEFWLLGSLVTPTMHFRKFQITHYRYLNSPQKGKRFSNSFRAIRSVKFSQKKFLLCGIHCAGKPLDNFIFSAAAFSPFCVGGLFVILHPRISTMLRESKQNFDYDEVALFSCFLFILFSYYNSLGSKKSGQIQKFCLSVQYCLQK